MRGEERVGGCSPATTLYCIALLGFLLSSVSLLLVQVATHIDSIALHRTDSIELLHFVTLSLLLTGSFALFYTDNIALDHNKGIALFYTDSNAVISTHIILQR